MTITRANVEAILVQRCGPLLIKAGMDGVTTTGSNASLNDPIGRALRSMGYMPANIASVSDSDLAAVADDEIDRLLDVSELRTLENISGNLDDVAVTVGPRSEQRNQLADQVAKKIDRITEKIQREYGLGMGTISAGTIGLDFTDASEDE
jgi:hypothetical protein